MRSQRANGVETRAIVERLYDVAVDPVSYESLLDAWEAEHADGEAGTATRLIVDKLDTHVQRASVFLDRYERVPPDAFAEDLGQHFPFSAIAINDSFAVIASNFGDGSHRAPQTLDQIEFLSEQAAEDVRRLALGVFRSGEMIIEELPGGEGPKPGKLLVKLRPATNQARDAVVVAVFSRIRWDESVELRLQEAFGFSRTEMQIVRLMVELNGRKEIAQIRNRSTETIKRHVSSIFQKTRCRSTGELLVLISSFVSLMSDDRSSSAAEQSGLRSIDVPTRRKQPPQKVSFVAAGAVDGQACIHLPGPYCLSRWPERAEKAARAERLRIITPIRGGYGPTLARGNGADFASKVVAEILTIMDALDIERAPFVTQSNDVVFAFQFARKHPDRISAIIACGGAPPMNRPEHYDRMDKWHRFILANARYAPRLLPFLVKAGFMLARRIGKQRFLERVHADVPGDMEVIADPACLEAILEGSRFALSDSISAHRAFADAICCFGQTDWSSELAYAQGRVPVHFVNGSDDPMTPAASLEEIRAAYPWIETHVFEHAGEFVFFRHWRSVLDLVHRHL